MKLTREQVSQLSNAELNRAMAWCYPTNYIISADTGVFITKKQLFTDFHTCVDYLTDYNLTMPLAIKHEITLDMEGAFYKDAEYLDGPYLCECCVLCGDDVIGSIGNNVLRAICEVLLMIAMESEV